MSRRTASPPPPDWSRVESDNSGLAVRSARLLGEGWLCRAWLVNDELVVRVPKRDGEWPDIRKEIAFLEAYGGGLPMAVPVYIGEFPDSPAAPHGYAIYRYIAGSPLKAADLGPESRARIADALAAFLSALHAMRPAGEVAKLIPTEDFRAMTLRYRERAERSIAPRLPASQAARLRAEFDGYIEDAENFDYRPLLIHADFSPEHIMADGGRPSGVVDFGDLCLGDPDFDFVYLDDKLGSDFALDVARRYGHADLDRLHRKLRIMKLIEHIDTVVDGPGIAPEGRVEAAWHALRGALSKRPPG